MTKHKFNRTGRKAVAATGIAAAISISIAAVSWFGADEPNRHVVPATSAETLSPWEECIANGSESCMDLKPVPGPEDFAPAPSYPLVRSAAAEPVETATAADSGAISDEAMTVIPVAPNVPQHNDYTERATAVAETETTEQTDTKTETKTDTKTETAETTTPETKEDAAVTTPTPETDVTTPTPEPAPEPEYTATIPDNNAYMAHVGVGDVMENNYGVISWNGGTIVNNYGEVHWNSAPSGINGTIVNNYGEVHHNVGFEVGTGGIGTDSTIVNNYGSVLGIQGNIENDNSGGVFK